MIISCNFAISSIDFINSSSINIWRLFPNNANLFFFNKSSGTHLVFISIFSLIIFCNFTQSSTDVIPQYFNISIPSFITSDSHLIIQSWNLARSSTVIIQHSFNASIFLSRTSGSPSIIVFCNLAKSSIVIIQHSFNASIFFFIFSNFPLQTTFSNLTKFSTDPHKFHINIILAITSSSVTQMVINPNGPRKRLCIDLLT